jgi:hypothetical protein
MVINDKVREITLYKAFALPLQKTTAIDKVLPAKKKKILKNKAQKNNQAKIAEIA